MAKQKRTVTKNSVATIGCETALWCMANALHVSMDSACQSGEGEIRNATP